MAMNWDTDLYPPLVPDWEWSNDRYAAAVVAAHEAAHVTLARQMGSQSGCVKVGATSAETVYRAPRGLQGVDLVDALLLICAVGGRAERKWWHGFESMYRPDRQLRRILLAAVDPNKPSSIDTREMGRLLGQPNRFRGDQARLDKEADRLVGRHWDEIQRTARRIISGRGRMSW